MGTTRVRIQNEGFLTRERYSRCMTRSILFILCGYSSFLGHCVDKNAVQILVGMGGLDVSQGAGEHQP